MRDKVNQADIIIINDNNLGLLGGERESQLIIINGARKEFKIAVIQPGEYEEEIENVDFYWRTKKKRIKYLIKNPFSFIIYIIRISVLINKISPKIIHSNSQVSFFIVSLLKRFNLIKRDIILIHTERGLYTKYNRIIKWIFQFSFKYTDTLVTTTNYNLKKWKIANEKKQICIEYKLIENTAGNIYEQIDETRIKTAKCLTIGFAGRMCDWKGWPLAEKICKEVNKEIPETHFIMCVGCADKAAIRKTENMFERMKQLLGDKFQGHINLPFDEMEQFYYDIDIYILTSWPQTESFGRTIVEAMSRKTAVLTTDAGGATEVVDDKETVCRNVSEFTTSIKRMDDNPILLGKMKKRNYERVRKYFSLNNNVTKYISLYGKKIKERE